MTDIIISNLQEENANGTYQLRGVINGHEFYTKDPYLLIYYESYMPYSNSPGYYLLRTNSINGAPSIVSARYIKFSTDLYDTNPWYSASDNPLNLENVTVDTIETLEITLQDAKRSYNVRYIPCDYDVYPLDGGPSPNSDEPDPGALMTPPPQVKSTPSPLEDGSIITPLSKYKGGAAYNYASILGGCYKKFGITYDSITHSDATFYNSFDDYETANASSSSSDSLSSTSLSSLSSISSISVSFSSNSSHSSSSSSKDSSSTSSFVDYYIPCCFHSEEKTQTDSGGDYNTEEVMNSFSNFIFPIYEKYKSKSTFPKYNNLSLYNNTCCVRFRVNGWRYTRFIDIYARLTSSDGGEVDTFLYQGNIDWTLWDPYYVGYERRQTIILTPFDQVQNPFPDIQCSVDWNGDLGIQGLITICGFNSNLNTSSNTSESESS